MKVAVPMRICLFVMTGAAVLFLPAVAGAANAKGCNNVINVFELGCAPWDNNTGPNYPYYRKREVILGVKDIQIVRRNGQNMAYYDGQYYVISQIMPQVDASILAKSGGRVIAPGDGAVKIWVPY